MEETAFSRLCRALVLYSIRSSGKSGRGDARRASNPRARDWRRASGTRVGRRIRLAARAEPIRA